jgi:DNA adenine methylase
MEPFLGSGAVFLNTDYAESVLCDSNPDLINLYSVLKEKKIEFVRACKNLFTQKNNTARQYYLFREEFNESEMDERRASLFVYLNRHCYNGLCRYNSRGEFNTPLGRYDSPYFPEAEMLAFADELQGAQLKCQDFRTSFAEVRPQDIVYCDPPYVPLNSTASFTAYAKGGFSASDQEELAALASEAAEKGAVVLISNHDTPLTRKLYSGAAHTVPALVQRMISCNGEKRVKTKELIAIFCHEPFMLSPEKWCGSVDGDVKAVNNTIVAGFLIMGMRTLLKRSRR